MAKRAMFVSHVMKNGGRSYEVETTRVDRPRDDVALPELNARNTQIIDQGEIEVQGDDLSVGSDLLSHSGRH